MPLQNRVDPFGALFRSPARGTMMGNRGAAIHNDRREIVRQYNGIRWITCVLQFKDRRRAVMTPGRYTELFFLDEAVSFAAGHRPCAECRRECFNAHRNALMPGARAPVIDAELHRYRIDALGKQVTFEAELSTLPNGCFVAIDGGAYLVWDDALLLWTPQCYTVRLARETLHRVTVLTPAPSVECFRRGYIPHVHESAF
jgi:hypothetical protein